MRRPGGPTISTDAKSAETFVGRWARVKRGDVAQPSVDAPLPEQIVAPGEQQDHAEARVETNRETAQRARVQALDGHADAAQSPCADDPPPAPVLTDADMPALSSLGDDDDYSGFMSPGVSEALRSKALRQLFMSAQFNVLDGLNDYDDDFTAFEALGDIVTSDMRHRVEMTAEQAARDAEDQRLLSASAEQASLDQDPDQGTEPAHEAALPNAADEVIDEEFVAHAGKDTSALRADDAPRFAGFRGAEDASDALDEQGK